MTEFIFFSSILVNLSTRFGYIGPGMGGGVIAAIFGIIAAFFLGLWGIYIIQSNVLLKINKRRRYYLKMLIKKESEPSNSFCYLFIVY